MLKIIDDFDLKGLEKLGFEEDDGEYYYNFKPYTKIEFSYLCVDYKREILTDYVEYEHISKMTDLIFELTQMGIVEKVDE